MLVENLVHDDYAYTSSVRNVHLADQGVHSGDELAQPNLVELARSDAGNEKALSQFA